MGRRVLMSLVSAQTVPNILFINEFKEKYEFNYFIFVTTDKMEKERRSDAIINTCDLNIKECEKLIVSEDHFQDIISKLLKIYNESDEYYFNLTGGTKIMSLGLYEFAKEIKQTDNLFYIPNGKNSVANIIFDNTEEIKYRLNIKEYFSSYNVNIKNLNKLPGALECAKKREQYTYKLWEYFNENMDSFKQTSEDIRAYWNSEKVNTNEKKIEVTELINIGKAFFERLNLDISGESKKRLKHWIKYLTGGWFEELIYFETKKFLCLDDEYISLGIEIDKGGDNELDVVLTYDNRLYYFECKTGLGAKESDVLKETFYKLSHLKSQESFGLGMNNILISLDDRVLYDNKTGELKDRYKLAKDYYRLIFYGLKDFKEKGIDGILREIFRKGA
ncbi:DUF1887 family protein [Deferribacterales bacterium Es71-Z0220]|uniref:Card1-like endonuclease domain-containing protein n=1 Tax=Deferrivibrio essentukiensis TaxID=2880922 RepID=UPI001F61FA49|nr:DUF1887 family CARF protein [Deferrivibrio essentukiensis]MCB4205237.1 DUF1887 family protein [Deferrivibrio essentukiensis]